MEEQWLPVEAEPVTAPPATLDVGPADDHYEREADSVADVVVRALASDGPVRRSPDSAGGGSGTPGPARRLVQRAAPIGLEGGPVDADTDSAIRSATRSGGRPLPEGPRHDMERAFGADFSGVRVHEGSGAADLNRRIQASAFTTGQHVFFRDGMPDTNSTSGQHLLAHELTHTIQQGGAARRSHDPDGPARRIRRAPAAVQRLVTQIQWNTASAASTPAAGAKGGIFFVTVGGVRHVVKASSEVGATMFGERMVGRLMGAGGVTAGSTPVPDSDAEHAAILAAIRAQAPTNPRNQAYDDRLADFEQSRTLLVQSDLSQNREMIKSSVQGDIALLQNNVTLRNIGRMLAADTLIGNSDRFEQMNVGNAFIGAADVGFIDTEALMQGYAAFEEFTDPNAGPNQGHHGVGSVDYYGGNLGKSQPRAYVDFLLAGGREISSKGGHEDGVAPSPNTTALAKDLTKWFENSFTAKFHDGRTAQEQQQLGQAGFPERYTNIQAYKASAWFTAVLPQIKIGFDGGLDDIVAMMTGPGLEQAKNEYDQDVAAHGATENFDFDAFRIRGHVMASVRAGRSDTEARDEAVKWIETKGNDSAAVTRAKAALTFSVGRGLMTPSEQMQIEFLLPSIDETVLRKQLLHLRGGTAKVAQKAFAKVPKISMDLLDNRLEAARGALLRCLLADVNGGASLANAVAATQLKAKSLRDVDIDQWKYHTKKGKQNARTALDNIGLNGAHWI